MPLLFESERMDSMPKKIDPQLRARCVRLVREHAQEYPTLTAATAAVARQEGVSRESVRRWLAQDEVDDGTRPGVTCDESIEVKRLKAEDKRLREDNEILRRASIFFAGSSIRAADGPGVHRRDAPGAMQSSRFSASCASRALRSLHAPTGAGSDRPASLTPSQTLWSRTRSASSPGPSTRSSGRCR